MRVHIVLRTLGFTAVAAILVASGHMLAQPPTKTPVQAPTKAAVINEVKKKIPAKINEAFLDLRRVKGTSACQAELDKAIVAATDEKQACLNPDNPPAGSPLDVFNKMTNLQASQYCGNLTGALCADKVLADQDLYCRREAAIEVAKARIIARRCEAAIKACQNARKSVTDVEANIVRLEKELAIARLKLPVLQGIVTEKCQ